MIRYEDIEPYLIDFLQDQADEATEYRIKAYLQQNPEFQQELDELAEMLNLVKKVPTPSPEPVLKVNFYQQLAEAQKSAKVKKGLRVSHFIPQHWINRVAASAAIITVVFMTGYWTAQQLNQQAQQELSQQTAPTTAPEEVESMEETFTEAEEMTSEEATSEEEKNISENDLAFITPESTLATPPAPPVPVESEKGLMSPTRSTIEVADITPEPEEDKDIYSDLVAEEIPTTVTNSLAPDLGYEPSLRALNQEATERLQAVVLQTNSPNEQTAQYLLERLQEDDSPNVKLLAASRLEPFLGQTNIQQVFLEALLKDDLPVVQLTMLDLIVKHRLKGGVPYIEELIKRKGLEPLVKKQARKALKVIS